MGIARSLLLCTALLATVLAGCSDNGASEVEQIDVDEVEATSTTGGIRGIVVDQAITPITGAQITVLNSDKTATTDETGVFTVSGLTAGAYFVKASHPLYDEVQQSVDVVAGVPDPKAVKFQLTRQIDAEPYMFTFKEQGFITCSANVVGAKSEECGEGVGVPGQGRVGQNPNNRAQIDFTVDGPHIATLIVEQVWEPATEAGTGEDAGKFDSRVALEWSCDPVCGGDVLAQSSSGSPLMMRVDRETLESRDITQDTVFSTFTWAEDNPGLLVEQEFELFVSAFYYLDAPADWSFVAGDPDPYA